MSVVFATTAANPHESSYACYFDAKRQTYLGDVYSVKWMEDSDKVHLILLSLFRIQINARIKCKEVFFNSYQYNDTQLHLNSLIHSLLNQRKYFKGEFKDRNSTEAIQNCEAGNQHKPCSGVWRNGNVHLNIAQDVVRDTHVLEKSETGPNLHCHWYCFFQVENS